MSTNQDPDNFDDLRSSPLWSRIQTYAARRITGPARAAKERESQLVAELEALRQQTQGAVGDAENASREATEKADAFTNMEEAVRGLVDSFASRLPQELRSVVPKDLPPAQLARWLSANQHLGVRRVEVEVDGASPRKGSSSSELSAAQAEIAKAVQQTHDVMRRGGRR
jgi:hypothetical protein